MRSWKNLLLWVAAGVLLTAAGAIGYFLFGFAPAAVAAEPMPLERYLADASGESATDTAAGATSPVEVSEPSLLGGARVYRDSCAVCDGLPGTGKTRIQSGMFPKPRELLRGMGVTDDPDLLLGKRVAKGRLR